MEGHLRLVRTKPDEIKKVLDGFSKHLLGKDRGASAVSYAGDVRKFIVWCVEKHGSFSPQEISPLDIVNYRDYLQECGGRDGGRAAPATVNRALVSLRLFFGWLHESGEIPYNPAADVRPVKTNKRLAPKWLTRREQAALMRAVKSKGNPRDEAMIGLMLHAGLRIGELCSLKREDVEIAPRGGHVRVVGKGNKQRIVPLNATIRKILEAWLRENPHDPIWPNRYGEPISPRGVRKLLQEYAYAAKLKNVTPHTLRHTFCKNLLDSGVPIDQVAMLAGHSSLDVTKVYTAPSEKDLEKAVEKIAWE
ncbi:MAG: tyrosine-type recombinase/integrase [Thermacetogeniaceae bacterium]